MRDEAEKTFDRLRLEAMDQVRCDRRLSASIRAVGGELFSLAEFRLGYAYPSEAYLVEKLHLSVRTVKTAVKALAAAGYFEVEKRGRNNIYRPIFGTNEKVQDLHLSKKQQVQDLHLSDVDRGKNRPQQVQKTSSDRCKKVPPTSLDTSLGASARGGNGHAGALKGAGSPSSENLGELGARLRQRLGNEVFDSWFSKATIVAEDGETLTLSQPTKFLASYIRTHFAEAILACRQAGNPAIARLEVTVAPAPVASIAEQRGKVSASELADARWLDEEGIDVVWKRLYVSPATAKLTIKNWLERCGYDPAGLRNIISDAAAQQLTGEQFRAVVQQRTKALRFADQRTLLLGPVSVKRNAS
jgi:hypothetical protein